MNDTIEQLVYATNSFRNALVTKNSVAIFLNRACVELTKDAERGIVRKCFLVQKRLRNKEN